MEIKGRAFVIKMISAVAMLLLVLWWFGDCLHHADVFNLPAAFGSPVEAGPIQLPSSEVILGPMRVGKKANRERRSIRGYREM